MKKVFRLIYLWQGAVMLVLALVCSAVASPTWIQLTPDPDPENGFPPPRGLHSAVYNPATNRMVVFGGSFSPGNADCNNDVWVLNNADGIGATPPAWKKLNPVGGPASPRIGQVAVLDQGNNRMILHGGQGGSSSRPKDTWILTNADGSGGDTPTWIRLDTGSTDPDLYAHSPAYDAANNRLIVQGGFYPGDAATTDTWVLTNANGLGGNPVWSKLEPTSTPSLAQWTSAGYDPATNTMISFISCWSGGMNQVWRLQNANGLGGSPDWLEVFPGGPAPDSRYGAAAVYDGSRNKMTIFGGRYGQQELSDVWRLENANGQAGSPQWSPVSPAGMMLPPRLFSTLVYNPGTDRMIVFGGEDWSTPQNFGDVWVLTEAMGPAVPPNRPPVANAGDNREITSELLGTIVIQGTASDPDQDNLQYRWLEGNNVILDWQPVIFGGEAYLYLNAVHLGIGNHTLRLEVSDGKATVSDEMILIIDDSAPHAAPSGAGTYQVNTPVLLGGQVSDYDGELLSYQWLEGEILLGQGTVQATAGGPPVDLMQTVISGLAVGVHMIDLKVSDGVNNPVTATVRVEVIDTSAPILAPVADRTILWPPNHQMVPVNIQANASDNSGLPVTLTATISCNEASDGKTYWTEPVINQLTGTISLQLLAERFGKGSGRKYTIVITAKDASGNASSVQVVVTVPHDQGKK
jgi:hypothetical protein